MTRLTRRWMIVLAALAGLCVALAMSFQLALRRLHGSVEAALGPRATLESISLHWTGIELRGLRVRALPGRWPAAEEMSAERVVIVPALSSLWHSGWRVASVTIEGARLSLLRTRDGKLRVLPSLLEGAREGKPDATGGDGTSKSVHIGELRLRDAVIDFHDASVANARGVPHRIRLEALHADVGPLALPALDERAAVSLQARLKGPQRSGALSLQGHLTPATRDAEMAFKATGLDLVALQPYLLRGNESSIKRGMLDLTLEAKVKRQRLQAPGRVILNDLEIAGSGGALGTFAGVPRQAVLAAMSRDGRIELAFTLEGRLDDPKFSLNELFSARFAVGLAEKLGVSIGGAVQGLGSVIKGLLGR
jgi:hypothetical protein